MRFLSGLLDWAFEGGFRRLVYRVLAATFLTATVADVKTNGVTDHTYLFVVMTVGMFVVLYSDDE